MDAQTLVMIQMILLTIIVSICSVGLSTLTYFLDFCFEKNNVFDFYLPWLAKKIVKSRDKIKYDYIMKSNESDRNRLFIEAVSDNGLFKMLGGCPVCFNVWLGFLSMSFFVMLLNYFQYPMLIGGWIITFKIIVCLFYLMVSNFMLRKMLG